MWIGFVSSVAGQEETFHASVLSEKGRNAYSTLSNVRLFATGGVGYGGETPEGLKALEVLIEEKKAISAFKSLVTSATLEGGLYGLFGLRMLNCDCFDSELARYRSTRVSTAVEEEINTAAGCFFLRAKSDEEKNRLVNSLAGEDFQKEARFKECRRLAKGRPMDTQKCVSEVLNNK